MTLLPTGLIKLVGERKIPNQSAVLHFRRKLLCEISSPIRRYNDNAQQSARVKHALVSHYKSECSAEPSTQIIAGWV